MTDDQFKNFMYGHMIKHGALHWFKITYANHYYATEMPFVLMDTLRTDVYWINMN